MSITKGFEERRVSVPMKEWSEHGTFKYWGDDIERLLKHARALETQNAALKAMLKKHEWADSEFSACPECGWGEPDGFKHAPDCQLAKLLGGVEP